MKILIIFILILLSGCLPKPENTKLYGAWVASVYNLDFPSSPALSTEEMKNEIIILLDGASALGLNAIFLQVRPCGDAIYPSDYYPWSHYLTGRQGVAPPDNFDPLKFWIEEAHKRNISLHAWINPFRVAFKEMVLSNESLAKTHPEWIVNCDGDLYVNPAIPEAQEFIVAGITEIIENYDIDGIHFDDYFYPSANFDDAAQYKNNAISLDAWRRQNINDFIARVSRVTREHGVVFGVSPFGIWQNSSSDKRGSNTSGLESYSAHFADTRRWVKRGLIDYIAPQIYWNIGHEKADFQVLFDWWSEVVNGTNVKLYIGHAGYKSNDATPNEIWYGSDEIIRQMNYCRNADGSIHYRLGTYLENTHLCSALADEYKNTH